MFFSAVQQLQHSLTQIPECSSIHLIQVSLNTITSSQHETFNSGTCPVCLNLISQTRGGGLRLDCFHITQCFIRLSFSSASTIFKLTDHLFGERKSHMRGHGCGLTSPDWKCMRLCPSCVPREKHLLTRGSAAPQAKTFDTVTHYYQKYTCCVAAVIGQEQN